MALQVTSSNARAMNGAATRRSRRSALAAESKANIYPEQSSLVEWENQFETDTAKVEIASLGVVPGDQLSLSVQIRSVQGTQSARAKLRVGMQNGGVEDVTFYAREAVGTSWKTLTGTVTIPSRAKWISIHFVNDSGKAGMQRRNLMLVRGSNPLAYNQSQTNQDGNATQAGGNTSLYVMGGIAVLGGLWYLNK